MSSFDHYYASPDRCLAMHEIRITELEDYPSKVLLSPELWLTCFLGEPASPMSNDVNWGFHAGFTFSKDISSFIRSLSSFSVGNVATLSKFSAFELHNSSLVKFARFVKFV